MAKAAPHSTGSDHEAQYIRGWNTMLLAAEIDLQLIERCEQLEVQAGIYASACTLLEHAEARGASNIEIKKIDEQLGGQVCHDAEQNGRLAHVDVLVRLEDELSDAGAKHEAERVDVYNEGNCL